MPTRRHQLDRILADIDRQISELEALLITSLHDIDVRELIEKIADLRVLRHEVECKRSADGPNPPTAH